MDQSVPLDATESCLSLIAESLRHTVYAGIFAQIIVLAYKKHLLKLLNFGCLYDWLPIIHRHDNYLAFTDDKIIPWLNFFLIIAGTQLLTLQCLCTLSNLRLP